MAAHAVSGIQGVIIVDVAGSARRRRGRQVRSRQREARGTVVERRAVPSLGRMAVRAVHQRKRRT